MMAGKQQPAPPDCRLTREKMQDYLDQTLPKRESLAVFLHVRECGECHGHLAALQALFEGLDHMPPVAAPDDFDARVLAAVPYETYRAMAPLRSPRVPVLLEHDSLPAWVRSRSVRIVGLIAAAAALAADATGVAAGAASWTVAVVGCLPELSVRLQSLSRRVYVATVHRSIPR
ncbi:MAG: zf-HC2 domain-containing protein [bacterium]|nr:zf-HC2 domain-containing protein [bacterium]